MKKIVLCIMLVFPHMVFAQGSAVQPFAMSKLTLEERLDRSVMNSISYMMMGISYAKSLGQTPEAFAEYSARMVIPAYEFLRGKKPIELLNIMNTVQQTDRQFVLDIRESTDSISSGRMTLFGIQTIKASRAASGVTVDDCYRFYNKTLSSGIGLDYKCDVAEDRIIFKLTKGN